MSRESMKLALEALETNNKAWKHLADSGDAGFWEAEEQPFYELSVKAIATLRQALAEPEPRNQCVETCERATLCAICAGGITEQEPVAEIQAEDMGKPFNAIRVTVHFYAEVPAVGTKLYKAPPKRDLTCVCGAVWEGETMVHPPRKREWVGLTDEEVSYFEYQATFCDKLDTDLMAELIEQALKKKNNGRYRNRTTTERIKLKEKNQ